MSSPKEKVQCPLCGYEFDLKEAKKACEACSFRKKCDLIMCPKCNYEFFKPQSHTQATSYLGSVGYGARNSRV